MEKRISIRLKGGSLEAFNTIKARILASSDAQVINYALRFAEEPRKLSDTPEKNGADFVEHTSDEGNEMESYKYERPPNAVRYDRDHEEWLDKDGFPVFPEGVSTRGIKDVNRETIRQSAQVNMGAILPSKEAQLKAFLASVPPKINDSHQEPGLLANSDPEQWEGRDETYDEERN